MSTPPPGWARRLTSRRLAPFVALLPLLLGGLLIGLLGTAERTVGPADELPEGSGVAEAAALADRLPDDATSTAIVLWTAEDGELSRSTLQEIQRQVGDLPGGSGDAAPIPSEDGTAAAPA